MGGTSGSGITWFHPPPCFFFRERFPRLNTHCCSNRQNPKRQGPSFPSHSVCFPSCTVRMAGMNAASAADPPISSSNSDSFPPSAVSHSLFFTILSPLIMGTWKETRNSLFAYPRTSRCTTWTVTIRRVYFQLMGFRFLIVSFHFFFRLNFRVGSYSLIIVKIP